VGFFRENDGKRNFLGFVPMKVTGKLTVLTDSLSKMYKFVVLHVELFQTDVQIYRSQNIKSKDWKKTDWCHEACVN
jgi:hypothetical protein